MNAQGRGGHLTDLSPHRGRAVVQLSYLSPYPALLLQLMGFQLGSNGTFEVFLNLFQ